MSDRQRKYEAVPTGSRLYQGEIVCGLIQAHQRLSTIGASEPIVLDEKLHPFAIVLTQDCDLESDYRVRSDASANGTSALANVLFCEAMEVSLLKAVVPPGKDIWKRLTQNKDERYQCIEQIPTDQDALRHGMPALGIDFKRYFTVSSDEVYKRIELGQIQRRCRLVTPYAEQLASRFFYFQSRLALPEDHSVPL